MKDLKDNTFGSKAITNSIREKTIDSSLIRLLEQSIDNSNINFTQENTLRTYNQF
jgi:hypothetical protein